MAWSERQTAMLRAMGLRTWQAPTVPTVPAAVAVLSAVFAPDQAAAPVHVHVPDPAPIAVPIAAPKTLAMHVERAEYDSIRTLDWPALREAAAGCRACVLCESRKQTVFGAGHTQARWMIIGEAPGAQEDAEGEPFVGAAGQLLDSMLRALGLSRSDDGDPAKSVYIANTLKCRPPGNRNPAPEEMARCEPFLQRQIELLQPRIILAMGRFAVQALLRSSEPVGRLRGRVHRYQGVPLVVTYHPAYLLRNMADKAKAWDDLCLAADTMDTQQAVL